MRAQDDQAGCQFWDRMLGGSLVRLAGTPEPLLPWLTDELKRVQVTDRLTLTRASTPVRLMMSSSSWLRA